MKKMKPGFMAIAVIIAIGSAFATKPPEDLCYMEIQYYLVGSTYYQAGEYGLTYYCAASSSTCTYWRPDPVGQPNYYQACKYGTYFPISPFRESK